MWRSGDTFVKKILPHSRQGRVYSSTLGASVPRRPAAPLWRVGYVECCGQEQLLCDGGSVASTVESLDWCNASAVCRSSMLCCCSTAVANSPCMRVAPVLQVVDQRVLSARKKRYDPKFVVRHLWRAMDCKSMVISNKGRCYRGC